jgi:hypothetical protein
MVDPQEAHCWDDGSMERNQARPSATSADVRHPPRSDDHGRSTLGVPAKASARHAEICW